MKVPTIFCAFLLAQVAMAEDNCSLSLTADNILVGGEQTTISLCMEGSIPITLIQADVVLPAGVTLSQGDGDPGFSCSSRSIGHTITSNTLGDGSVRFIIMSSTNKTFSGNEGQIAGITLDVNPNIAEGEQEIRLTNILLVQPTEEYYRLSDATISLTAINQETATAINASTSQQDNGHVYNLSGQQAKKNEKGVIIQHGKKTAVR